jgi:hypothetical protein
MDKWTKNSKNDEKKRETGKKFPEIPANHPNRDSDLLLAEVLLRYKGKKYTTIFIAKSVPCGTLSRSRNKKEGILVVRIADHSANLKNLFQRRIPPDFVLSVTIANVDTARRFRTAKKVPRNVIELAYDSSVPANKILEDISTVTQEITRKIQGEKGNLVPAKSANHG